MCEVLTAAAVPAVVAVLDADDGPHADNTVAATIGSHSQRLRLVTLDLNINKCPFQNLDLKMTGRQPTF